MRYLWSDAMLVLILIVYLHSTGGYDIRGNNRSSDVYRLTEDALVYCEGGLSSTNAHSSDMWPKCAVALRSCRSHHTCIAFNDKIWVVAGVTRESVYAVNQVELLDPVVGTSEVGPSLNKLIQLIPLSRPWNELSLSSPSIEGVCVGRSALTKAVVMDYAAVYR